MPRYCFLLPAGALLTSVLAAQAPPGTDIYVASLTHAGAALKVGAPVNVTLRPGYDNQPFFTVDGRSFYYTSARGGQTDIYRYDLASASARQITDTPRVNIPPRRCQTGNIFRWSGSSAIPPSGSGPSP
jgi:hypothetical protein